MVRIKSLGVPKTKPALLALAAYLPLYALEQEERNPTALAIVENGPVRRDV